MFGDAELALLKQVAANITFALQYLRKQGKRRVSRVLRPADGARQSLVVRAASRARDRGCRRATISASRWSCSTSSSSASSTTVSATMPATLLLQLVAERLNNVFRDTGLDVPSWRRSLRRDVGRRRARRSHGAQGASGVRVSTRRFSFTATSCACPLAPASRSSPTTIATPKSLLQQAQTALAAREEGRRAVPAPSPEHEREGVGAA